MMTVTNILDQTEMEANDFEKLILLHMRLECKGVVDGDLVEKIDGPYPDDIARVVVVKSGERLLRFIAADLPEEVRDRLRAESPERVFDQPEIIKGVLGDLYPKDGPNRFVSYVFPTNIEPGLFAGTILLGPEHQQLFEVFEPGSTFPKHPALGVIVDGKLMCVCESSREDDLAAESWVRTLEAYRGKGFAKTATLAWAVNLQKQGKTPYYSHKATNEASKAVAKSLGLVLISEEVSF